MHGPVLVKIVFALVLVLLNGFFVAAEFSFVRSRKTRLQEMADGGSFFARMAVDEIEHLDVYLSTTQVGITLASLGLGWAGEPAFAEMLDPLFANVHGTIAYLSPHLVGALIAFSMITYLHILFGELIPKTLSIIKPETVALVVSVPLYLFHFVFFPIIWVLNRSSNVALRAMGLRPAAEHTTAHTEEEIRMILAESARGGSLRDSEALLVEQAFDFADTAVHAVMVPRVDVEYLSIEWENARILEELDRHPHTRYLVVEDEDLDEVRGFVHLKELVSQLAAGGLDLPNILRPIHIVPETQSIERLMRELQTRRSQIALVLDEYGGTAGIVTMEDLVEELIGEITDEMDEEPPEIQRHDGVYRIQGGAALSDISRELKEEIESEHYDTLGGWVMGTLERVPDEGDSVESQRYTFRVTRMDGPRIVEVEAIAKPHLDRAAEGKDAGPPLNPIDTGEEDGQP